MHILEIIGRKLALYLAKPSKRAVRLATCNRDQLASEIRKGDVLLVEGSSRISTAIKYLTQSTWSHSALCTRDSTESTDIQSTNIALIEADVVKGVHEVPLSKYWGLHTRICRPIGLTDVEINNAIASAESMIGHQYDLKNVFDLARYLIQRPPVPSHWRRRMIAIGSGDPTRAICSSLIAQAFQAVRYPILPLSVVDKTIDPECESCHQEYLHIRHHSLFAPRDFDISPYFKIIKPTLEHAFDPHSLVWFGDNDTLGESQPG